MRDGMMIQENQGTARRTGRGRRAIMLLTATLFVAVAGVGCKDLFEVTNPGPIQESFLDDPLAHRATVNGMGRALAQGLNWLGYTGAAVTREVHPAGSTGSFGITNEWAAGILSPDDRALNVHWEQASRARWLAESGVARMRAPGAAAIDTLLGRGQLWAGYANRLLGEHYCQAVIDGGALQPRTVFFERAEGYFTDAIQNTTGNVRLAAYAGRASVRVHLNKWAEAVADAQQVTAIGFELRIPYFSVGSDDQRNRIAWAAQGTPYKAHTLWNTPYEFYGQSNESPSGDPRVSYSYTAGEVGDAAITCCGQVPFKRQRKYANDAASMRLSSGAEMRLIEAEAALIAGNWQGAMILINAVRAAANVPAVTAASADEAWTRLKRERGIELWLEGRRLGDLYRWNAANRPGEYHDLETPGGGSHLTAQNLCFPVPPSERETNPNIPVG
jgi:starch-binding outer membrane protein, SusD/RagB family